MCSSDLIQIRIGHHSANEVKEVWEECMSVRDGHVFQVFRSGAQNGGEEEQSVHG